MEHSLGILHTEDVFFTSPEYAFLCFTCKADLISVYKHCSSKSDSRWKRLRKGDERTRNNSQKEGKILENL